MIFAIVWLDAVGLSVNALPMNRIMPRFLVSFALLLGMTALLTPIDTAHAAERRYSTGNFNSVRIFGDFDVVIESARGLSVRAEGDSLLINRIIVRSSGRVLTIRERNLGTAPPIFDDRIDKGRERIKIYITAPSLASVSYQGDGNISVAELQGSKTSMTLIGNGTGMVQRVDSDNLVSNINGRAVLTLLGNTKRHRVVLRGYGGVDALELRSENAEIIAEGPVIAEIAVSDSVSGLANDGADVLVIGTEDCSVRTPSQDRAYGSGLAAANVRCILVDDRPEEETQSGEADK